MSRAERGFTLVELLISIVLLALLTTLLFGGLQLGTRRVGQETDRLDRASRLALMQNFLRRQLADARPLRDDASPSGTVAFAGGRDGLRFVNPTPASAAKGGFEILSVEFVPGARGAAGELLLRWRPEAGGDERQSVLLDQLRGAEFAYFGVTGQDGAVAWHDDWHDMSYLPSLIRLAAVFTDGQVMPDMIVALRLSPGAAGQYLPVGPQ